jgi:hypothetical protein
MYLEEEPSSESRLAWEQQLPSGSPPPLPTSRIHAVSCTIRADLLQIRAWEDQGRRSGRRIWPKSQVDVAYWWAHASAMVSGGGWRGARGCRKRAAGCSYAVGWAAPALPSSMCGRSEGPGLPTEVTREGGGERGVGGSEDGRHLWF